MTTVLITGASGTLGTQLLAQAPAQRHLRALSRRERAASAAAHAGTAPATWHRADLATGDGLDAALHGVHTVIHAASDARDSARADVEGTRSLLAAAARHAVQHLVYISIVGIDRVPLQYYQHKLAAERLVADSGVPYSIVRGTQFHDFMRMQCTNMTMLPFAVVPRGFVAQPIHVDEFADAVWRIAAAAPAGSTSDIAGPEVLSYETMVTGWLNATGTRKRMLRVPVPGRIASAMRSGALTAPDRRVGTVTWSQWLAANVTLPVNGPGEPSSKEP